MLPVSLNKSPKTTEVICAPQWRRRGTSRGTEKLESHGSVLIQSSVPHCYRCEHGLLQNVYGPAARNTISWHNAIFVGRPPFLVSVRASEPNIHFCTLPGDNRKLLKMSRVQSHKRQSLAYHQCISPTLLVPELNQTSFSLLWNQKQAADCLF